MPTATLTAIMIMLTIIRNTPTTIMRANIPSNIMSVTTPIYEHPHQNK